MEGFISEINRPRDEVDDLFFVKYPFVCYIIAAIYVWFVKISGPKFMEKRQPYNITNIIKIYNTLQVLFNGYAVCKFLFTPMGSDYLRNYCHYFNTPDNPTYVEMASLVNQMLILKIVDLLDSVFMVLKKKNNQLSFLHILHHSSVIVAFAMALSDRDGVPIALLMLNAFVHVIMYFYYFLSGFKALKKPLAKWKSSITRIQLIQFVIMLLFMISAYIRGCSIGARTTFLAYFLILTFMYLFGQFYVQSYLKKRRESEKPKQ